MPVLKDYGSCIGPLDFPMTEDAARDLEKKLDSGEYSPLKLFKSNAFEAFFPGEKADISIVSDGTPDKDGEIISPKSLNWSEFRKNPVVTFGHNYTIPPVGKSIWQKLVSENTWKAKTQYVKRPDDFPSEKEWFPDTIFHMIKEGALPGKSIGGAVKWRPASSDESTKGIKRVSEEVMVYEYSVVPVQSNNNAIVEAVSKHLVNTSEETIRKFFPEIYPLVKDTFSSNIPNIAINIYTTPEQYNRQKKLTLEAALQREFEKIPDIVDRIFKRFMGRVS